MKTIWLVTANNGGHEAGWPVRAFGTKEEADRYMTAEHRRLGIGRGRDRGNRPADAPPIPESWVDGDYLSVEEVPFGATITPAAPGHESLA